MPRNSALASSTQSVGKAAAAFGQGVGRSWAWRAGGDPVVDLGQAVRTPIATVVLRDDPVASQHPVHGIAT